MILPFLELKTLKPFIIRLNRLEQIKNIFLLALLSKNNRENRFCVQKYIDYESILARKSDHVVAISIAMENIWVHYP